MKMILIFFTLVFFGAYLFAENEWAPIGTVWYYDINTDTEFGFTKIESIKDTVVLEKVCKLLSVNKSVYRIPGVYETSNLGVIITHQDNNKVYILRNSQFYLLYDFNPSIGEIWNIGEPQLDTIECPNGRVIVDSIKYISLNSNEIKAIYTSPYNNSSMKFTDKIIEGIGCLGYLLPISTCNPIIDDWGPGGPIRCYNSPNLSYSWSNKDCDFITAIKVINYENLLLLFPNPFSDILNVKLRQGEICYPVLITIWSISGEKLMSDILKNEDNSYSLKNLESGVYFLTLSKNNSLFFDSKIIRK